MNKISAYFSDAVAELHQVRWPTRQQAIRLTGIVIVFVAISTAVFGIMDYGLAEVVQLILSLV